MIEKDEDLRYRTERRFFISYDSIRLHKTSPKISQDLSKTSTILVSRLFPFSLCKSLLLNQLGHILLMKVIHRDIHKQDQTYLFRPKNRTSQLVGWKMFRQSIWISIWNWIRIWRNLQRFINSLIHLVNLHLCLINKFIWNSYSIHSLTLITQYVAW